MRRSNVVALLTALVLAVGIAVVVLRVNDRKVPRATPTPSPTTATPSVTPSATTASPTTRPTPAGNGPRDREYEVVLAAGITVDQGAVDIAAAGGEIVDEAPQVGVVRVKAGRDFVAKARRSRDILGVVTNPAIGLPPAPDGQGRPAQPGQGTRRTDSGNDPLSDLQWDMDLIKAPQARAEEPGDERVLVAVIDTGVDKSHPDLAKAYDTTLSRNFVTDYPGADGPCEVRTCKDPVGTDPSGHGTHVAGTIAAAADGFGMAGIAPGVRLVDLRAGQDSGLFFLMPTVQALVYAADIGVDVANLSYFVDPWLFNCAASPDDDADDRYEQRALIEGVKRAVDYAIGKGVTLVAAAGNEHMDMDSPRTDDFSPDFPEGAARLRRIDDSCHVLPTTLPGVLEVSALARDGIKADYSNYGLEHITVTAPGGSSAGANGEGTLAYQTLSTFPLATLRKEGEVDSSGTPRTTSVVRYCRGSKCGYYRFLTGTSMAAPHVTGVAALIVSHYGKPDPAHPGQLTMPPASVQRILTQTATAKSCPSPATVDYARRPAEYRATCRASGGRTSFYGAGVVNALAAVSR